MTDDYLFDRKGVPDPEVADLEQRLAHFRERPRVDRRIPAGLALAAALLLMLGLWSLRSDPWSADTASCQGCTWTAQTWLDTSETAMAKVGGRGELIAQPGSRLRRLEGPGAPLALEEGALEVRVNAPAEWLTIDIPGVQVVDLGCAYALRVANTGHGHLAVQSGMVELRGKTRTWVPAGAEAASWPDGRTGLPVRLGATDRFRATVDAFDQGRTDLGPVLREATTDDAITVLHAVRRGEGEQRAQAVATLEALLGGGLPEHLERLDSETWEAALARVIGQTL